MVTCNGVWIKEKNRTTLSADAVGALAYELKQKCWLVDEGIHRFLNNFNVSSIPKILYCNNWINFFLGFDRFLCSANVLMHGISLNVHFSKSRPALILTGYWSYTVSMERRTLCNLSSSET